MMEFELLRSFVAVAECGGFHRAAAFGFVRRSAHCASRKRIGLADRLHEPQSYGCPRRRAGWSRDHAASGERDCRRTSALAAMEELAAQRLPQGVGFEWTDLAYEQKQAGNSTILIFGASLLFVFMVLAAQYESWSQPLSVILIVPMCLLAAVSGLLLRGMSVDILAQIGFVVLVALASKNAILIVEFAKQAQDEGASVEDAAVRAARTRLRPILMTSLAFILGVVPLAIATGAGAEMRQSLGTAVFFGMLGVTVFGLLFTPTFYTVVQSLSGRLRGGSRPARRSIARVSLIATKP